MERIQRGAGYPLSEFDAEGMKWNLAGEFSSRALIFCQEISSTEIFSLKRIVLCISHERHFATLKNSDRFTSWWMIFASSLGLPSS